MRLIGIGAAALILGMGGLLPANPLVEMFTNWDLGWPQRFGVTLDCGRLLPLSAVGSPAAGEGGRLQERVCRLARRPMLRSLDEPDRER